MLGAQELEHFVDVIDLDHAVGVDVDGRQNLKENDGIASGQPLNDVTLHKSVHIRIWDSNLWFWVSITLLTK